MFATVLLSLGIIGSAIVSSEATSSSYQNGVYFVNCQGIYDRNYHAYNLPASELNRVFYAFLDLATDGQVVSRNSFADLERRYPGDLSNEPGQNAYGCVKQLYMMKKKHRHMKVILSIGGWTLSENFPAAASTSVRRERFAKSAVTTMGDWGFDGIDIDWEYPANDLEAANFLLLLQTVRRELDAYGAQFKTGYRFLLSIASSAGPEKYNRLNLRAVSEVVDSMNLMAYDYSGAWGSTSAHQSNIRFSNSSSTPFSTEAAVTSYLQAGVNASKIVVGMPLYGRAFQNTSGIGQSFSGVGGGSWEAGIWDYKALPRGSMQLFDPVAGAAYSYDSSSRELISFDTPAVVREKVAWIKSLGLAGSMFWEASGDRVDGTSLIRTSFIALGSLHSSQNWLSYPNSKYANIAANMPGS